MRIFCDSSFDPKRRHGVAAFLMVRDLHTEPSMDAVVLKFFDDTTNTRLELQSVLLAVDGLPDGATAEVYTDCANILGLFKRRARLQSSQFANRKGEPLANADIYRDFFVQCDRLNLTFTWVEGHTPVGKRAVRARIFAIVDKAARGSLRAHNQNLDT